MLATSSAGPRLNCNHPWYYCRSQKPCCGKPPNSMCACTHLASISGFEELGVAKHVALLCRGAWHRPIRAADCAHRRPAPGGSGHRQVFPSGNAVTLGPLAALVIMLIDTDTAAVAPQCTSGRLRQGATLSWAPAHCGELCATAPCRQPRVDIQVQPASLLCCV